MINQLDYSYMHNIIGEPFVQPITIQSTAVDVTAINCVGQRAALKVTLE